jgi:protein-tyrosine phosphatase
MSIFQIQGPWAGRLAVVSRPRGGDWIDDEVRAWKDEGLNAVVSLLTGEEQREFELSREREVSEKQGLQFFSFPINDLGVPSSLDETLRVLSQAERLLASGRNVGIHCRQSIGRSGMMAACLLVMAGSSAQSAMESVSNSRGLTVPETPEQIEWVSEFEREFAPSVFQR